MPITDISPVYTELYTCPIVLNPVPALFTKMPSASIKYAYRSTYASESNHGKTCTLLLYG